MIIIGLKNKYFRNFLVKGTFPKKTQTKGQN